MKRVDPAVRRRFNWRLVLVVVGVLAAVGGGLYWLRRWQRERAAQRALQAGLKAYEARDWTTAAWEIGRYLAVHRRDTAALLKYAHAQLGVRPQKPQNVRQATAAYRQVLRDDPTHPEASDRVAGVYLLTSLPAEAEMILRRRLAATDDPAARHLLAVALARQHKIAEAADQVRQVLARAPERIAPYQFQADLMREHPDVVPGEPAGSLRLAVSRNPDSAEAHIALGMYLARWGAGEAAKAQVRAEYDRAGQCDLSRPETRVLLAAALLDAGDARGAEAQLEAAGRANGSLLGLWHTWADLVRREGSAEKAPHIARRALEALGPESFPFLPTAADLFILGKDEAAAEACIEKIKEADPGSSAVAFLRGRLAQSRGEARLAVSHLKEAVSGPQAPLWARLNLAQAYAAADDPAAALRELRTVVGQWPESPVARLELARLLVRVGAWREAAQHTSHLVRLAPADLQGRVLDLEARAHLAAASRGDTNDETWRPIADEVRALEEKHPKNTRLLLLEAEIARLRKDLDRLLELARALQADGAAKVQGALLEVEVLLQRDDRRAALARLQDLVKASPGEPALVAALSDLLWQENQREASVAALEGALKHFRGEDHARLERALALRRAQLGDAPKAREILQALSKADPADFASRELHLALLDPSDQAQAQRIVDEIRAAEGEEGFRWRYHQARIWLASREWQGREAEIVRLLEANVKADPHDLASHLLLGSAQEKAGKIRPALETYRRAYERNPDSARAAFQLVLALQKANDHEEAGRVLEEAARLGLVGSPLDRLKLTQQLRSGEIGPATETAEELLRRDPDNEALRLFVARLKMRQGSLPEARALIEKLDATKPNVAVARVDLLMREGKPREALAVSDQLVAAAKNAPAHLFRARARAAAGELDLAEADCVEVTRLAPDQPYSWIFLSDFLAARNRLEEAVQALQGALKLDQNYPPAVLRAVRLYSISPDPDRRAKAETILDSALAAHPQDAALQQLKADRLVARNTVESLPQARALLEAITKQYPRQVEAWIRLAQIALMQGLPDAALDVVSRGLAAGPTAGERQALLFLKADAEAPRWPSLAVATLLRLWQENQDDWLVGLRLIGAHRKANDPAKATALAEDLWQRWKKNHAKLGPVPALALAGVYREMGKAEEAVRLLKEARALVADADAIGVELALAEATLAAGRTDEALETARKVQAKAPDDPRPILALAGLLAQAGRWGEIAPVLADWQKAHPKDALAVLMRTGEALAVKAEALLAQSALSDRQAAQEAYGAAQQILEALVKEQPRELAPRLALATVCQSRGRVEDAEKLYRQALADVADHPVAINNLAWLLCEDKKAFEEALALADRGRKRFPAFPDLVDTRGVIYHRLRRLDDAAREFQECIRVSPRDARSRFAALFHLARVLADQRKDKEAIARLNECLGGGQSPGGLAGKDRAEAESLLARLNGGQK